MSKKLTTEEFIEKAKAVHEDRYDYSKVEYVNNSTPVCIICHEKDEDGAEHGEFCQKPSNHLFGKGCPKCGGNAKITTEEFIKRARKIHGDEYDYSKVNYKDNKTKVCIICYKKDEDGVEHGEFWQTPSAHFSGQGCPKCGALSSKNKKFSNKETFVEKAKVIHGDKYDYSNLNYVNAKTKSCIICHEKDDDGNEHGEFWQEPNSHLNGNGCPKCGKIKNVKARTKTIEQFIKEAKAVHGDKYDYSKAEYITNNTNLCIICPIHGEFWQTPSAHFSGQGCPKCGILKRASTQTKTTEEFIEEVKKIHGDKYDYSKVKYINNATKVCVICHEKNKNGNEHGEFWVSPLKHINRYGCPICKESKLEGKIALLLDNNTIKYERQKKFPWLGALSLDFYLPDYNIAIECQGRQHFEPVTAFGGEEEFKKILERDARKLTLCEANGIKLLLYSDKIFKKYNSSLYCDEEELLKAIKDKDI